MKKVMDHSAYMKKVRKMSKESLEFVAEDASQAIRLMPDNPNNGYYADEVSYCYMELARREKKGEK